MERLFVSRKTHVAKTNSKKVIKGNELKNKNNMFVFVSCSRSRASVPAQRSIFPPSCLVGAMISSSRNETRAVTQTAAF